MRSVNSHRRLRALAAAGAATVTTLCGAAGASALPPSHGQGPHLLSPRPGSRARSSVSIKANQSTNWFGYNQSTLEPGKSQFTSITGEWVVPTASPHKRGEDESSSDWVGIGGGCLDVDSGCNFSDGATLIQAGTEQDVAANGKSSYFAWYELIPAPSSNIPTKGFPISPGDLMYSSLSEQPPDSDMWAITLKDLTRGTSYSINVDYTSSHATAEWIEEPPFVVDQLNSGQAPLPNLSRVTFYRTTADGAPAGLSTTEQMQLVDQNGNVFGDPSDPNDNAFNLCAWASSCAVPSSATPDEATVVQTRKVTVKHGIARIALVSPVAATGTVTLTAGGRLLARAAYRLAGKQSKFISLGLGPKALKRLTRKGRLVAAATTAAKDMLGVSSTSRWSLTLKPARRR